MAGYRQIFSKEQGQYPAIMTDNGQWWINNEKYFKNDLFILSSLWKKASCDGACTFYLTIFKNGGIWQVFFMFLTHFDESKFISCSKADTNFPCFFLFFFFFRRQNCLHVFISLRLNFYIFRFLWEMFQKFTDHVSPLHAIIFLARYQAAYSARARRAQDGIWYPITMPTDTIMIIGWEKRFTGNIS